MGGECSRFGQLNGKKRVSQGLPALIPNLPADRPELLNSDPALSFFFHFRTWQQHVLFAGRLMYSEFAWGKWPKSKRWVDRAAAKKIWGVKVTPAPADPVSPLNTKSTQVLPFKEELKEKTRRV